MSDNSKFCCRRRVWCAFSSAYDRFFSEFFVPGHHLDRTSSIGVLFMRILESTARLTLLKDQLMSVNWVIFYPYTIHDK